uniref:Cadherin domain-containing protein n=1 Tax=Sinocyclocheilus rhinocerous TaxID=307959 RepID=A0A673FEU7_9TELE
MYVTEFYGFWIVLFLSLWESSLGQIVYSVSEEVNKGTISAQELESHELCGSNQKYALNLEAFAQNPHRLYRLEIIIVDVNDNAPFFPDSNHIVNVTEDAYIGDRLPLPDAKDSDVGSNSLKDYKLISNEYFSLDVHSGQKSLSAELVLQKALDREKQAKHTSRRQLVLL